VEKAESLTTRRLLDEGAVWGMLTEVLTVGCNPGKGNEPAVGIDRRKRVL
jgi:hypothetical protein